MKDQEIKPGQVWALRPSVSADRRLAEMMLTVVAEDGSGSPGFAQVSRYYDGRVYPHSILKRVLFVDYRCVYDPEFPTSETQQPSISKAPHEDTALLDFLDTNLDALSVSFAPPNSSDTYGAELHRDTAKPGIGLRELARNFLALRNRYVH